MSTGRLPSGTKMVATGADMEVGPMGSETSGPVDF